ncbi:MAG: hypothetical protein WBX03_17810, partial [Terriglobales bacterium]
MPPVFEAFDPQTGHLPKLISLDLHGPPSTRAPEPSDGHDSGGPLRPALDLGKEMASLPTTCNSLTT